MAGNPKGSRYRSMPSSERPRPGWKLTIHRTVQTAVEAQASAEGMSPSEWMERLACRELRMEPPPRKKST